MFLNVRRFCFSLVILLGLFLSFNSLVGNAQEDDIRIDVPADIGLLGVGSVNFLLLFLQFKLVEAGFQHLPGSGTIFVLRALALACHHYTRRNMRDANRRVGRVDVLAART